MPSPVASREHPALTTAVRELAALLAGREARLADRDEQDWKALATMADRHGIASLLEVRLAGRADVPASFHQTLRAVSHARRLAALQGMSEMLRAAATLHEAGISCVALKGPALSLWLYGDVALRRFSDVDLLVPRAALEEALRALAGIGYTLPDGMTLRTARTIFGDLGAMPLTRDGALPLDLHWRTAQRRFRPPFDAADVLASGIALERMPPWLHVPLPSHTAGLVLLHAAKHGWGTLEMLWCISRLMVRDDVDWALVRKALRSSGVWAGGAAGIVLASRLFDAPVPEPARDGLEADVPPRLIDSALHSLSLPAGIFADRSRERRTHLDGLASWRSRLQYDCFRLLAPTPLEWRWCRLPEPLTPLYVPVRLARLTSVALRSLIAPSVRPGPSRD